MVLTTATIPSLEVIFADACVPERFQDFLAAKGFKETRFFANAALTEELLLSKYVEPFCKGVKVKGVDFISEGPRLPRSIGVGRVGKGPFGRGDACAPSCGGQRGVGSTHASATERTRERALGVGTWAVEGGR